MSVTATLISAFHALEGAEIDVRPPRQIIVYRNETGSAPIATLVISLDMINDSGDQADAIVGATLKIDGADAAFPFNGVARFVPSAGADKCSFGASCAPVSGFLIETSLNTMVLLPKGEARTVDLSFPLDIHECKGKLCPEYRTFDNMLGAIDGPTVTFRIEVEFHDDGKRTIDCLTDQLSIDYLRRAKFTSTSCRTTSVSGATLL